ncbi:RagB/SusD family nutrient uptake outer membrane protein [Chitinophaga sp. MM2321]|uniref:RagB/SusD family nutrient uptake outer membrane protein n=1 Tax=Chitinophaga sp. MM2321 TaxID=3137178 RepID=UPI0032D5A413
MTNIRLHIKILLAATILMVSCKHTLELDPTHLVPDAQMWRTKNDARSAVFATYGMFRAALADNNAYLAYGELRGGDFSSASRSDLDAVTGNQLNATYTTLENWKNWRRFYAAIAQANLCLEKLSLVHENDFRYTVEEMKLDIANIRFLRALTYFYLVRIWGDVPMVTTTTDGSFTPVQRESQAKILAMAGQDATAAAAGLPWQYNQQYPEQQSPYWGQGGALWKGVIASKGAAYALLAHIAAWSGDYLVTEKYTRLAIDNKAAGGYTFADVATLTGVDGTFAGQAPNVIFALPFNKTYQESSAGGHIEDWALAEPFISRVSPDIYVSNDSILRIFNEPGDLRFKVGDGGAASGNYFTGFGNPLPMFTKIKQLSITGADPLRSFQSAIIIFRYEELVLLRAEAMLFLSKNPDAIQLLNSVRAQRGLPAFKATDGNLAQAILQERRRELLGEGWRWYDLVRFDKLTDYSRFTSADIAAGAQWWPVAKDVLDGSKQIIQNKFWQQ